jgi:mRNA interferase MazF
MKDFDNWNRLKYKIDRRTSDSPYYKEREIRWCNLGLNVGYELDGKGPDHSRPVLILKGFSRNVCLVAPLTTSKKKNIYHAYLGDVDGRDSFLIISQIRLIDTKRLDSLICTLEPELFQEIKNTIKNNIF